MREVIILTAIVTVSAVAAGVQAPPVPGQGGNTDIQAPPLPPQNASNDTVTEPPLPGDGQDTTQDTQPGGGGVIASIINSLAGLFSLFG